MELNENVTSSRQTTFPLWKRRRWGRTVSKVLFSAVAVAAGFCLTVGPAGAQEEKAEVPAFLFEPFYASHVGSVYGVYEARHADLVLVSGGLNTGFRTGMICRVQDGVGEVGEVILIEVRHNCAAGLILALKDGKRIEPGHAVRTKTVVF